MVGGDKKYVDEVVRFLKVFNEALGMEITGGSMNSRADQFGLHGTIGNGRKKGTSPSSWAPRLALVLTNSTWTYFFPPVKIAKKLDYWSTMSLSLIG